MWESVLSCSHTPTASTIIKRSLTLALGLTTRSLSGEMTRTPRPFICSKKPADFTLRRKNTHSIGFTSVPVEIMSTVTAILGKKLLRKLARISSGVRLEVLTHSIASDSLPSSFFTFMVRLVKPVR